MLGNPIAHSKSPFIHQQFAAQTGQALRYQPVLVPLDGFARALQTLQAQGWRGVNITLPFKQQAYAAATELGPAALAAGAVNTLQFSHGKVIGDNTDGAGLVLDLRQHLGCNLTGARVLLLGAGGAARGAIAPLLAAGVSALVVANRTHHKAIDLVAQFAPNPKLRSAPLAACDTPFDLVINATAAGLSNAMPQLPVTCLGPSSLAYDMVYGPQPTVFMHWAAQTRARTADGLGMLVAQAAESFFIWRGVRPALGPVLASLRAS